MGICPPSKLNLPTQQIQAAHCPNIAHPVNDLAHRKMGTTIIKNQEFKPKFWQHLLKSKYKLNQGTPRICTTSVLSWNLSISKFTGQHQHTFKLMFMKFYIVYKPTMASRGWYICLKISKGKGIIYVRALKNWRLPP